MLPIGIVLILVGLAFAGNWHRWAERYAAWVRSNFGTFAWGSWSRTPDGVRVQGVIYVIFGFVLEVIWATVLVGSGPAR